MTELHYYTLDVFTDTVFAGNPLAVVFGGEGLDTTGMQKIAAEFNLSETVFVLPPVRETSTRRVRIFTPRAELAFAGHPSIGAAWLLAALGEGSPGKSRIHIVLEEIAGDVEVEVDLFDGCPVAAMMAVPVLPAAVATTNPQQVEQLAPILGLALEDLNRRYQPCAYSCGTPFLFVCLASLDALGRARLHQGEWEKWSGDFGTSMIFLFTFETASSRAQIRARMFAPSMGIAEDPATGSAVSALAGVLCLHHEDGKHKWLVEQGVEMGRPSKLVLEYECRSGQAASVRVGGAAVRVSEGSLSF